MMATAAAMPGDPGSIVASLHNPDGLDQVYAGRPVRLQLRLGNATTADIPVQVNRKGTPLITVDFSTVDGTVTLDPAAVASPGFVCSGWDGWALTLTATTDVLWWYVGTLITVDLGEVTIACDPGLAMIAVQMVNVTYQLDDVMLASLVVLEPPGNAAGKVRLSVAGGPVRITTAADETSHSTLAITAGVERQGGVARTPVGRPRLVLSNCSGNWPGYNRPSFQHYSGSLLYSSPDLGVVKAAGAATPVNVLELPEAASLSESLTVTLPDLVSRGTPQTTHIAAYNIGFPGVDDGVTVIPIEVSQGTVSIDAFIADVNAYANILSPVVVQLSWSVNNATYVTLSGVGLVPGHQVNFQHPVPIAATTTFVLTAYDAALTTIVSRSVTVTIGPELATRGVPCGTVMAWKGGIADVPPGWLVCDGRPNTPNLTDRFILGAGGGSDTGDSGKADTHTHTITLPTLSPSTSSNGEHTHGMPTAWYYRGLSCGHWSGIDITNGGQINAQTKPSGGHTHSTTISFGNQETGASSGGVRPPWYALYFIVKG